MPVRLGIELSPAACRIVELESNSQPGHDPAVTRIRSFARLPREGVETREKLLSLQHLPAAVVVWGLEADHRQVVVQRHSFGRMRREAVAAMRKAGVETRGRVADIFAAQRTKNAPARPVVVALASTPGIVAAVRRLADEGVQAQSIVTPALALMSLARLRRTLAAPDRIDAYVALEESTTAIALVRNGLLLAASELEGGFQDEHGFMWQREEMARRLADDIERFLAAHGARPATLAQVCLCGGFPELRSMAMTLMEALDVEVEPLDSLFGIDADSVPESAREFPEQAVDFRLAWAVAADWPAPVNLLRERNRRRTKMVLSRAAVAAGVITGVAVAWQVQRSQWWRSAPPRPRPAPVRPIGPSPRVSSTPAAVPVRKPPPPAGPPPPALLPSPLPPPVRVAAIPPSPSPLPPPPARTPAPTPLPRAAATAPVRPPVVEPAPVRASPARPTVRPTPAVQPVAQARVQAPPPAEIPLPFDAVLGSILYAPERKLAIVDGRIVEAGDDVNGARVVDITPTAVLLRDAQGRLRRLGLGASAR